MLTSSKDVRVVGIREGSLFMSCLDHNYKNFLIVLCKLSKDGKPFAGEILKRVRLQ